MPSQSPVSSSTPSSSTTTLAFNGVNATTGEPLSPRLTPAELGRVACGEARDSEEVEDLRRWQKYLTEDYLDVRFGIDSRRLGETGWGAIFPHGCGGEILEALRPLLDLRRRQTEAPGAGCYQELTYRSGESKSRFLARHRVGPGPVDPARLAYYLLLVGSPEEIPFRFQYQLDVQYAVGRLHFETSEEYARYAESVVAVETGLREPLRKATFFGVANPGDRATQRSLHGLVEPLAASFEESSDGWTVERCFEDRATKASLGEVFGKGRAPGLLFTASHGVGFHPADPRQLPHQGALLCQDWPGPEDWRGAIPQDHYLAGEDVASSADVSGLIAFHFACFGAGTPRYDSFDEALDPRHRKRVAPRDFVARLPQRLLAHPRGSALAIVGHVDKAWGFSFDWPRAGEQLQVFESALRRLLAGYPVGAAMEYFNQRHAELSTDLSHEVEEARFGARPDFLSLSALWTANNDARSYVVLGDPAVRLPAANPEERP